MKKCKGASVTIRNGWKKISLSPAKCKQETIFYSTKIELDLLTVKGCVKSSRIDCNQCK